MNRARRGQAVCRLLLAAAAWIGVVLSAAAQEKVVVDGYCAVAPHMTRAEARSLALDDARARAVAAVATIHVQSEVYRAQTETMVSSEAGSEYSELFSMVNRTSSYGMVVAESVLEEGYHPTGTAGTEVFHVRLRCEVVKEEGRPDPGFVLEVSLNQRVLQPSRRDELIVSVTSSRDAYVVLLSVSNDTVTVLLPNEIVAERRIRAGGRLDFPSAEQRASGLHLRPELPTGVKRQAESIMAIATVDDVPFRVGTRTAREGIVTAVQTLLPELNRWLARIPPDRRTSAVRTYEIRTEE